VGQSGELTACDLDLGELDPITETTGVQARLKNLGFYDGAIDGEVSDEFLQAIAEFREKTGLPEGNAIDDALCEKLREIHRV